MAKVWEDPNYDNPLGTGKFASSLFDEKRLKQALADRFFLGNVTLCEEKLHFLSEELLSEFFAEYAGPAKETQSTHRGSRPYNVIVYGASGYTGQLLLEYVCQNVGESGFRFALAGRTPSKVEKVKSESFRRFPGYLANGGYDPPVLKADLADPEDIKWLVTQCDVIVNIAGPFITSNAESLVEACLMYKTDYIDVNGEVPFTHKLLQYHEYAKRAGVMVVPNCAGAGGQADLTAYFCAREARKATGEELRSLKFFVTGASDGGPSGGTLATRAAMAAAVQGEAWVGKLMQDPFALGGRPWDGSKPAPEDLDKNLSIVAYDSDAKVYKGPFMYGFFETRVIRRSNGLFRELNDQDYGKNLIFQEHTCFETEAEAKALQAASSNAKEEERKLKESGKLKGLGEGASAEERNRAFMQFYAVANTMSGKKWTGRCIGGDGYEETARFSMEMALLLSLQRSSVKHPGGVLTPAVAGGDAFLARLEKSGLIFEADYQGTPLDTAKNGEGFSNKLWQNVSA